MYKKLVFLLSISLIFTQTITNLNVFQLTDGSGQIQVSYDLIDESNTFPSFNVEVQVSIDGGDFQTYSGSDLTGDAGENVIPGISRILYIQAPDETYSANVVVKIIASAHIVTSEIPFTMIQISSTEGVSSYQGESISYSYEIMQNELTNADLVTFLETYDFNLDENGDRIYSCDEYTDYFNSTNNGGGGNTDTFGCNDPGSMNYDPEAQYDDGSCVYEWQIGCDQDGAANHDHQAMYNDCSCYTLDGNIHWEAQSDEHGQEFGSCDWYTWFQGYGMVNELYVLLWDTDSSYDPNLPGSYGIYDNSILQINNLCSDASALNNFSELNEMINLLQNTVSSQNIEVDFWECVNYPDPNDTSSCVYECDNDYFGGDDDDDGNDGTEHGNANISDFQSQDISYQGSSFVIESGAGEKPALLNYNNCVDGVILGLLLDYYGLRLPTGSEWTKSARMDNDRCWPWMSMNCEDTNQAYCEAAYTCQSEEDFEACQDNVQEMQYDCYDQCSIEQNNCNDECGCNSSGNTNCSDYDEDENECINHDDCTWLSDSCVSNCYGCMMDPDNNSTCFDGDGNGNPCMDGCPCCSDCDMSGGSCDDDCQLECNLAQNECQEGCSEYNNSWEYCGGQEQNDCTNNFNSCTNQYSWNACEEVYGNDLIEILEGDNSNDSYDFTSFIYDNKFFITYQPDFSDGWDGESLELSNIGQYPEGISPFGLYDIIGNAPELVKHDNLLWSVGLNPFQSMLSSFCANDEIFLESDSYNSHATGMGFDAGSYFQLYGLRLARTTQEE